MPFCLNKHRQNICEQFINTEPPLAAGRLTDHHEAGLVVKSRPVGVDERLLQLLGVDEATVVRVDSLEPLVRLWVDARRDATYTDEKPER